MLYLIEAVDEYCIQSLPEFEGKKFQNVAKEGLKLEEAESVKVGVSMVWWRMVLLGVRW